MTVRRILSTAPALLPAFVLVALALPGAASAQGNPCTAPVTNEVACENTKAGNPESEWGLTNTTGDESLQGFATSMSVNRGSAISFKIDTTAPGYTIDIYRIGYYNGDGARRVVTGLAHSAPQNQPNCQTTAATGLIDCGNWAVSATWNVPTTMVSGLYIANLTRTDDGGSSHITFVVRNDTSSSDVTVQTSDTTWQAYNTYGGNSLYRCEVACPNVNPDGYMAALAVSYNRPFQTASVPSWWTSAEYPMIRFLEANGYNLNYVSGVDVHARGNLLQGKKVFLAAGHDEYWSASQRNSVKAARDSGTSLAFFTGNEVFWKTRWADSTLGTTDRASRTHDLLQGHALPGPRRPGRVDRHLARPALRRAARDGAGELAHRAVVHRQQRLLGDHRAVDLQGAADVAQHAPSRASPRARARPCRPRRSATSGTRTPTTASAPPASSASPRPPSPASRSSPTTAPRRRSAPRRTT